VACRRWQRLGGSKEHEENACPFDIYAPEVAIERRNRIRVALAAWAYERYADPIMSDAEFDKLAQAIRPR
jgi:hypothetical protein